jgi:hypothetical protein
MLRGSTDSIRSTASLRQVNKTCCRASPEDAILRFEAVHCAGHHSDPIDPRASLSEPLRCTTHLRRELMIADTETSSALARIVATDIGVAPTYRHAPKLITPGEPLELPGTCSSGTHWLLPIDRCPTRLPSRAPSAGKCHAGSPRARVCHPAPLRRGFLFPDHQHVAQRE